MVSTELGFERSEIDARAGAFSVALLILTSIHHVYGALVYHTPWRMHVMLVALPLAAAIILLLRSKERSRRTLAAALILVFPVLLIGVFEGGYNHLLKNLVYLAAGEARTQALFPPPAYEMPHDIFFELSGIAQFLLAPFAAAEALKIWRSRGE